MFHEECIVAVYSTSFLRGVYSHPPFADEHIFVILDLSMSNVFEQYKRYFTNKEFLFTGLLSIVLLTVSLIVHFYAVMYATEKASNSVTDIVLNNIRVYDVHLAFIHGPILMWGFVLTILLLRPNQVPFTLNTISLFVLTRAVFINLTHIGPFPTELLISPESFINYFSSGGDLFFSAHTGLPFLLALLFWQSKALRYLFLLASAFFGVVVLLGHLHYTIDVVAAFFITFSVYRLSEIFFAKDKHLFDRELMVF